MKNTRISQKGGKRNSGSGTVFGSISKKQNIKTLSKKKQKALSKSSKVMIEKMNNHTTEDDIANIIMSVELQTDTKAVENNGEDDNASVIKKDTGLRSLATTKLKTDQVKDAATAEKHKAVQDDIAEQLKMIDDFTL